MVPQIMFPQTVSRVRVSAWLVCVLASVLSGCRQETPEAKPTITISGAGSTFAEPIIRTWATEYQKKYPEVEFEYEGVGSGKGEALFRGQKVHFAGTDAGIKKDELDQLPRGPVQVPITAGIIVLAYHPEALPEELKLPREIYTEVFLGREVKWNDPRIQKVNPEAALPDRAIVPVVRRDRSGTTHAFTNHLAAISPEWRERFGNPESSAPYDLGVQEVAWPGSPLQASGNSGVAGLVRNTPFSLGYVQYGAARETNLPMALLENREGKFVEPAGTSGLETLLNAKLPPDLLGYYPDPEGEFSYPLVTFTWVLLYSEYPDAQVQLHVRNFVRWCLSKGQDYSEAAGNVRLAPHVTRAALKALQLEDL